MREDDDIPKVGDTWYRFEDRRYSTAIDPERETDGSTLRCKLLTMTVSALTPRCVWLGHFSGGKDRLVRLNARKMAYHPTKDLALESFIARKTRQVRIYTARLADAKEALKWAKALEKGPRVVDVSDEARGQGSSQGSSQGGGPRWPSHRESPRGGVIQ